MYQLYEAKEHVTAKKLLVYIYNKTSCHNCQTVKCCVVHNTGYFTKGFTVCWKKNITITTAEQHGVLVMQ